MVKDFSPVIYVGSLPFVLAINPGVPANSVRELIELARAKPGQLNFGSAGTGGSVHLAGELFKLMAHVEITHVPYKGTSAAVPDLISGRINMMFPSAITVKQFADAGRVRLLAVTSRQRSPDLPQLPTAAEPASVKEGDDSTLVPMVSASDYFWIVVAGGDGRHSAWMPAWNVCEGATEVVATP